MKQWEIDLEERLAKLTEEDAGFKNEKHYRAYKWHPHPLTLEEYKDFLRFNERDVKDGRKIVVKLWNVARMCFMYLSDFNPAVDTVPVEKRPLEDQWILSELNDVKKRMTESFEKYDYATAKDSLNKFFWMQYCDDYLELVKGRFWDQGDWTEQDRKAAQSTLHESLRTILGAFAPFLPYITEEIYQKANRFGEKGASLHTTSWPSYDPSLKFDHGADMDVLLEILHDVRKARSVQKIGGGTILQELVLEADPAKPDLEDKLQRLTPSIRSAARASKVVFDQAGGESGISGLKIKVLPYPDGTAPAMQTLLQLAF